jgi:plasmid stabilization system protein ParE
MTPRLFVRSAARADLTDAVAWYEGRRSGLGDEFLSAVAACFASVEASPGQYRIAIDDIRMALVNRFPYVVYFVELPHEISILAVLHGRRSPLVWQQRR